MRLDLRPIPHDLRAPLRHTLGGALDEMARSRGGHPALIHFDETIGYRELQQRAQDVARALLALGVQRGDRVGVLLANQPEWVVMCFAAAYVGATFVPLNTWYKKTELAWTIPERWRSTGWWRKRAANSVSSRRGLAAADDIAQTSRSNHSD